MNFEFALAAMRLGKKVRLSHWDKSFIISLKDGQILMCGNSNLKTGPSLSSLAISQVLADDWEVVEEPPEQHDFHWAMDEVLAVHQEELNHG